MIFLINGILLKMSNHNIKTIKYFVENPNILKNECLMKGVFPMVFID